MDITGAQSINGVKTFLDGIKFPDGSTQTTAFARPALPGGTYSLAGTIGGPDAGVASAGSYTLNGGFPGGEVASFSVYLPMVIR